MSLQAEQELMEGFGFIPDIQERLAALVSQSFRVETLPEEGRVEANLVRECQSPVWVEAGLREGRLVFRCHSGSPLVGGLVRVMCHVGNGCLPAELIAHEPLWLRGLGLDKVVSLTRQEGLAGVWRHMVAQSSALGGREEAS